MQIITECRSCQSKRLQTILSLGKVPIADRLLDMTEVGRDSPLYPLTWAFCRDCTLVQIYETLPPEELFCRNYPYFSSFSDALVEHSRRNVRRLIESESLNSRSQVIEIASNDGYLLRHFATEGIPVLGIDPAAGPVEAARKAGIPTEQQFFTEALAAEFAGRGRMADVLIANNVLAHVADTTGFVRGLKTILKPSGVATIEFPYVRDLVERCEFDTIYHQHLCYFSLTSVETLLASAGLVVHDVERLPIHGGSLRLHVSHDRRPQPSVKQLRKEEADLGITDLSWYRDFAARVTKLCSDVSGLVGDLHGQGKRVAAYGAAAKATTLVACLRLPDNSIGYVVDRNVHKHGRYMPGCKIPIVPVQRLLEEQPDYVLLLAWNFETEILAQQYGYRRAGGKFIVPIPEVRVISEAA